MNWESYWKGYRAAVIDLGTTPAKPAQTGMCKATSPRGYTCTEQPGHGGYHTARGVNQELCDSWPVQQPGVTITERPYARNPRDPFYR